MKTIDKDAVISVLEANKEQYDEVTNILSSLLCIDELLSDTEISSVRAGLLLLKHKIFSWYDEAAKVDSVDPEQINLRKSFIQKQIAAVLRNLKLNSELNRQRMDMESFYAGKPPIIILDIHNIPPAFDLLNQVLSRTDLRKTIFVEQFSGVLLRTIDLEKSLEEAGEQPSKAHSMLSLSMNVYNQRQRTVAEALFRRPSEFIARALMESDTDNTFEIGPRGIPLSTEEDFINLNYVIPTLLQAKRKGCEIKPADVWQLPNYNYDKESERFGNFMKIRDLGFALHLSLDPNSIMVVGASHGLGVVSQYQRISPANQMPICIFPTYSSLGPEDPIIAHRNIDSCRIVLNTVDMPENLLVLDMSRAQASPSVETFVEILRTGTLSPISSRDLQIVPSSSSALSTIDEDSYNLACVRIESTFGRGQSSEELRMVDFNMPGALPNIDLALRHALKNLRGTSSFMGTPVTVDVLIRMQKLREGDVSSLNFCLSFDASSRQITSGGFVPPIRRVPTLLLTDRDEEVDAAGAVKLRSRI